MRSFINAGGMGRLAAAFSCAWALAWAAPALRAQEPAPLQKLAAPLDLVLHDASGRAINARVYSVSATEVEFEDRTRGLRFAVPLTRLRRDHRDNFLKLHEKLLHEAKLAKKTVAPETPWLRALRADLLAVPRGEARLRPMAEGWFGDVPFVVVVVLDDGEVYNLGEEFNHWHGRNLQRVAAPVVWLAKGKDALLSAGNEASLPPNYAFLAHGAWRRAAETAAKQDAALASETQAGTFAGADERVAERSRRVLDVLPSYWPRAPWFEYWAAGLRRLDDPDRPRCFLLKRDGRVATYRGAPVAGEPALVASLLATRLAELERENGAAAAAGK